MLPEDRSRELENLAAQLLATSNQLSASIHPILRRTLGDLVRSMNCYYSNLIEGHHTHPVDINRALAGDYSAEPEKRNLQLEAVAHIEVQREIDAGAVPHPVTSKDFRRTSSGSKTRRPTSASASSRASSAPDT
jgi:Fic family protein